HRSHSFHHRTSVHTEPETASTYTCRPATAAVYGLCHWHARNHRQKFWDRYSTAPGFSWRRVCIFAAWFRGIAQSEDCPAACCPETRLDGQCCRCHQRGDRPSVAYSQSTVGLWSSAKAGTCPKGKAPADIASVPTS